MTNTNTVVEMNNAMNFKFEGENVSVEKVAKFDKLKKSEKFALVVNILEQIENSENLVDFIEKEIEMNDNRNAKRSENKKLSKTQVENAESVKAIVEYMATQEVPLSSVTILDNLEIEYSSTQKATSLLKQAMDTGEVVKSDKKVKEDGKTRVGYIHINFADTDEE